MDAILNSKSKSPEPDRPQHDRPAACYRPAVFFRHLRLIALSLPEQKCYYFNFFFFFTFLKLHNFKLRK